MQNVFPIQVNTNNLNHFSELYFKFTISPYNSMPETKNLDYKTKSRLFEYFP